MTARNTYGMHGHFAVCQVSYALERDPFPNRKLVRDVEALHDVHHLAMEINEDGERDDFIEECDRAVLRLWLAEFGTPFPMKRRADSPITGAEAEVGITRRNDKRRIDPPVMGLDVQLQREAA